RHPSGARRHSSTMVATPHGTDDRRVAPAGGGIAVRSSGAQPMGLRSPGRLGSGGGVAVCSPLGVGVILQSSLASKKLRESTTRSVSSPAVVLPHSSMWREQPILPHSPVWREQPILPQGTYSR